MPSESFRSITDLCLCRDRSECELIDELKLILAKDPDVVHERDDGRTNFTTSRGSSFWHHVIGGALLHRAAKLRSIEFCKVLFEENPQALRLADSEERLPFHYSCVNNNVETAKYLFRLYPECINATSNGEYPIHCLLRYSSADPSRSILAMTQFLLNNDRGAVTKPDSQGYLPVFISCHKPRKLEIIELLFNAYPEAVYFDMSGGTFLDYMRRMNVMACLAGFLNSQVIFAQRAEADSIPDENGQLPIHRELQNTEIFILAGAIKLMINANPESICVANNQGCIPLHIAVNRGDVGIVKCLIEANVESLTVSDLRGNCTLHHACLAGKCDIINCILRSSSHGASVRNSDGKLPIQLLLYDVDCERDNLEFVGAIHSLLCAYPNFRDIAL